MKKFSRAIAFGISLLAFSNSYASESSVAKGNNDFGINLYHTLSAQSADQNIFISPYSIYSALAIAYAGSHDATKAEFEKTLGIKDATAFHPALSETIQSLNARDGKGFSLLTANALWVDQNAKILDSYRKQAKKYYSTAENTIDVSKPEDSSRKINGWVSEKTKSNIKELVSPGNITPNTKLVITNAVYFKGDWSKPFQHVSTQKENFNLSSGKPVKVQMMHQESHFKYMELGDAQFIQLPYKDNELSMVIALPKQKGATALTATEKKLADNLGTFLSAKNADTKVNLALPKFKVEAPLLQLNEPLKTLGLQKAFSPSDADFSGITGNKTLFIGDVLHKAVINVDELGTEAAAATAVVMTLGGAITPDKIKEFKADHPFIYVIRDEKTGIILFMGKLLNPLVS